MTPFIQSLISNQAQNVDRITIKDAVKPVNPVVPKPIPQAIPTRSRAWNAAANSAASANTGGINACYLPVRLGFRV